MANTSLPISMACLAVIKEPDLAAASTTKQPCDRPAMSRLRLGKLDVMGGVLSGYSLINKPWAAMLNAKA